MDISALPARERILVTSHDLFYRAGIRATGIDRVIAASGVTKVTFYRHFPSKDDLVRAFLDHRHGLWMAWFVDALGRGRAQQRLGAARSSASATRRRCRCWPTPWPSGSPTRRSAAARSSTRWWKWAAAWPVR